MIACWLCTRRRIITQEFKDIVNITYFTQHESVLIIPGQSDPIVKKRANCWKN